MEDITIKRCAIYTRKSHEEGLDQDFNSLDAQREAAENYIRSQKHNGWQILPGHYDDGGFSGGTTDRPALKQLLADVEAGKIDIIVVYKLDRLSRSLLDFMNMADFLEQHNVSFVSVTQDINTSTSAGRMMLNILMTFAQYEREVIAERIRDKIAGAKKRGKHCGGCPVLGYDANDKTKKLEVNYKEAIVVQEAFELYSQHGSAREVARILNSKGYQSKEWTTRKGRLHKGGPLKADMVYRILNNPIYIGEVVHKDKTFPGEHEAIIDRKKWDDVQTILKANLVAKNKKKSPVFAPFKGLLKCGYCGGAMGITYTEKNSKRYSYYLCQKDAKRNESECPLVRVATGDIDREIIRQLGRIFRTPALLSQAYQAVSGRQTETMEELVERCGKNADELAVNMQALSEAKSDEERNKLIWERRKLEKEQIAIGRAIQNNKSQIGRDEITEAFTAMDELWEALFPVERYRLAHLLFEKITIFRDQLVFDVKTGGMESLVRELLVSEPQAESVTTDAGEILRLTLPIQIKHRDNRRIVLLPEEEVEDPAYTSVNTALVSALAKAHLWLEMLDRGEVNSVTELASRFNAERTYVGRTLNLVNLSPELQTAILRGNEPDGLNLKQLRQDLPMDWHEQIF